MAGHLLTHSLVAAVLLLHLTGALTLGNGADSGRTKRAAQRKVRVVTLEHEPYVMKAEAGEAAYYNISGVGYVGFIPDLLYQMGKRLDLNIEVYLEPEGRYGSYNKEDNSWNGMIGEVMKRDSNPNNPNVGADIAAADTTITAAREKVVNYIKPFQHHGLTMVIKKTMEDPKKDIWDYTFDILKPLSGEVWAFCSIATLVVGLLLWANNRFNPYEWGGRYEIGRASEAAAESFNFQGSLWFAFTSLQWQGFDRAPRSMSSKVLTVFWFIFVTITLVTYTGSVVNHLFWASTVHGRYPSGPPISSLRDLVRQNKVDYGYIQGGSTDKYFQNTASGPVFDVMRKYWARKGDSVHVKSTAEGIQRVKEGNYVFFMERYSAEYAANQHCDIMLIGELLAHRDYGFVVPHSMDHQLSEDLHTAILEMMEEGDIEEMEKKWWRSKGACWRQRIIERKAAEQSAVYINKPKVVSMNMFWGPVVLLAVGVVLTILVAIAEVVFFKYKGRYQRQNRPGDAKLQMDDDAVN